MPFEPSDEAIDEVIATCDGDTRGALKALMMINEQLEAELQNLYAAVAHGNPRDFGKNIVH